MQTTRSFETSDSAKPLILKRAEHLGGIGLQGSDPRARSLGISNVHVSCKAAEATFSAAEVYNKALGEACGKLISDGIQATMGPGSIWHSAE